MLASTPRPGELSRLFSGVGGFEKVLPERRRQAGLLFVGAGAVQPTCKLSAALLKYYNI